MKSQIDSRVVLSEIGGYRRDANFTITINRVCLAGETAWVIDKSSGEVTYFSSLASALNALTSAIRHEDEQKQLLRALIS